MKSAARIAIALILFALVVSAPLVRGQQLPEPLPSSTLPLRLLGVVRDLSTPAQSAGLIQCGSPEEQRPAWLVAVGERACDVAEVREVREEAVVIRNLLTSRLELLTLPKAGTSSPPAAPLRHEATVDTERDEIQAAVVRSVSPDVITVELKKEMLHRYMSNLPEVLSSALATPRFATGGSGTPAVEGFEMSRIKAGGIADQLGLRDGDVLLEFNGQKLNSLAAVAGLLAQAEGLSGSKMTVLRSGDRITFLFSVK